MTRQLIIILLILFLLLGCCCTFIMQVCKLSPSKTPKTVDNFQVTDDKPKIVLYYASWCGHSKMFLPVWDAFETVVKSDLSNKVETVKIKCEGDTEQLCYKKGVNGYPTVILYTKNKTITFSEQRELNKLVDFVKANC